MFQMIGFSQTFNLALLTFNCPGSFHKKRVQQFWKSDSLSIF